MQIDINGYKINYEVEGEGKNVILLHGWLASLETMKPIANHLKKHFKVYNIDVIGFGKSDLPREPLHTEDFGNFLHEFIKTLKIENPILIGHSNGGRTILNYASRQLGKINKIVLIDSAGIKPKRKISYYIKIYTFKALKKLLPNTEKTKKLREKVLGKFGSTDYKNSPEVLRKTMSIILNEDIREQLPNIQAPTLLIWGENDTATPIRDAKIMEKLIPNAGLVTYKQAGHFSYLDYLPNFLTVLDEFFKNDY
ncbi:MAG: alpha/beta hydrolase [Clostridia bacterium]|nr:alpha/beta hydrolase [Clostridia bacterium]